MDGLNRNNIIWHALKHMEDEDFFLSDKTVVMMEVIVNKTKEIMEKEGTKFRTCKKTYDDNFLVV